MIGARLVYLEFILADDAVYQYSNSHLSSSHRLQITSTLYSPFCFLAHTEVTKEIITLLEIVGMQRKTLEQSFLKDRLIRLCVWGV